MRAALEPDVTVQELEWPRAAGAAGTRRREVLAELAPGVAEMSSWMSAPTKWPAPSAGSPAPAIPARTATRSPCPRRLRRGAGAHVCLRMTRRAHRAWRAGLAAARGRPLPLRPRHRRRPPRRSRRALSWAIQKVRRADGARRGRLSGRRSGSCANWSRRRRACASACCPEGRAPMREGVALFAAEDGGQAGGTRHLRRFRPHGRRARRHGICARRDGGPGHAAFRRGARQAPAGEGGEAALHPRKFQTLNCHGETSDEVHRRTRMAARRR